MASEALTNLRNSLLAFVDAQPEATSTRDIVAGFRATGERVIGPAVSDLVDLALTKLVDEVSRRRQSAGDPRQGDLFRKLSLPHVIVVPVIVDGKMKPVRTPTLSATIRQAQAYSKHKPRTERQTRDKGMTAFLETHRAHIRSLDQTVGEVLAAAEAAEQAAAAAV